MGGCAAVPGTHSAHVRTCTPLHHILLLGALSRAQQYRLRNLLAAHGPNVMCQVRCLQRRWRRLTRRTSDLSLIIHRGRRSALHLSSSSPQLCSSHHSGQATLTVAGVECRGTMIASHSGSAPPLRFWRLATSDIIGASCPCLWRGSCFPGRLQQPAGGVAMQP